MKRRGHLNKKKYQRQDSDSNKDNPENFVIWDTDYNSDNENLNSWQSWKQMTNFYTGQSIQS